MSKRLATIALKALRHYEDGAAGTALKYGATGFESALIDIATENVDELMEVCFEELETPGFHEKWHHASGPDLYEKWYTWFVATVDAMEVPEE